MPPILERRKSILVSGDGSKSHSLEEALRLPSAEGDEEDDGEGAGAYDAAGALGLLGERKLSCTVHVGDLSIKVVKMYPTTSGARG